MLKPRLAFFLSFAYLLTVLLIVAVGLWSWEGLYLLFLRFPGSPTVHLALWIALLAVVAFTAVIRAACGLSQGQFYGLWPALTLAVFAALGLAFLLGGAPDNASLLWASFVLASLFGVLSHFFWSSRCSSGSFGR